MFHAKPLLCLLHILIFHVFWTQRFEKEVDNLLLSSLSEVVKCVPICRKIFASTLHLSVSMHNLRKKMLKIDWTPLFNMISTEKQQLAVVRYPWNSKYTPNFTGQLIFLFWFIFLKIRYFLTNLIYYWRISTTHFLACWNAGDERSNKGDASIHDGISSAS